MATRKAMPSGQARVRVAGVIRLRLLRLLALAPLVACAGRPAAIAPGLPTSDTDEVRALLLYAADHRLYEPLSVERALAGDASVRRLLAASLGWSQVAEGRPVLAGLLLDASPAVRLAAACSLGRLGDPAAEPALLAAVGRDDRAAAAQAVGALGQLGTPLATVLQALQELPPAERWARLLPHLDLFVGDAVAPLARHALELPGEERLPVELRLAAARALAARAEVADRPLFRRLDAEGEPRLRAVAGVALAQLGGADDLAALAGSLDDPDPLPLVRTLEAVAARLSRQSGSAPAGWSGRLVARLRDPRPSVRLAVLGNAAPWLAEADLAAAVAGLARAGEPWERAAALAVLVEVRHPLALPLAVAAAQATEPGLRAAAARAAGRLGAHELLAPLVADPSAQVRAAAAAPRLALAANPAADALVVLSDPDIGVRASALAWLALHPVVPVEALSGAIRAAVRDDGPAARLAGLSALVARGLAQPLERGAVVVALESLAGDPDFLLRRAAAEGLRRLGRDAPAVGGIPGGWTIEVYRNLLWQTSAVREMVIETSRGRLVAQLDCPQAPLTCLSFQQLAARKYFDGQPFFALEPERRLLSGDPRGDGWGGPGYTLRDEPGPRPIVRGTFGLDRSVADSGGSRFFIALAELPELAGATTVFAQLSEGFEVLDRLAPGDRIRSLSIR